MKMYKALAVLTVFVVAANVMEAPAFHREASPAPVKKSAPKKVAKKSQKFQRGIVGGTGGI